MTPDTIFQLLEYAQFGACATDRGEHVLFWNSGAQRILGHRAHQVVGLTCSQLLGGMADAELPAGEREYPHLRSLREGFLPDPFQLQLRSAREDSKLVRVTPMVLQTGASDGPLLVYLFDEAAAPGPAPGVRSNGTGHRLLTGYASTGDWENDADGLAPGESPLTERELEVLHLVALGLGTPRIAEDLTISSHTVLNHIRNSRRKLGAASKLEAVVTAIRHGLLQSPDAPASSL